MNAVLPEPLFLQGATGQIFALYQPAQGKAKAKDAILYLPPFAEEMNRCRFTVAQQARALSDLGHAVLLLDPYGTGDSAGEMSDATWEDWVNDVETASNWLEERTSLSITLWGLRLGALLAADAANRSPGRYKRLLFWQPVQDGKMFLTQYLRLRIAFLMDRNLPAETTDDMRNTLKNGGILEVAGYPIGGRLADGLDTLRLSNFTQLGGLPIEWFELVAEVGKPLAPGSQKTIQLLTELGCQVQTTTFCGPPLWQLHKRDELPDLIDATTNRMKELV